MKLIIAATFVVILQLATPSNAKTEKANVVPASGKWATRGKGGRLEFPDSVEVELQEEVRGNRKMNLKKQSDASTKTANRLLKDRGLEQITGYSDPEGGFSVVVSGNGDDFDVVGVIYEDGIECMLVAGVVTCPDDLPENATYLNDILQPDRLPVPDARKKRAVTGDVTVEMCISADYKWYSWVESLSVVGSGADAYVTSILLLTALVNEIQGFYKDVGDGVYNMNFVALELDVITSASDPTWAYPFRGRVNYINALLTDLPGYAPSKFDVSKCDTITGITAYPLSDGVLGVAFLSGTCDPNYKQSITGTFQVVLTLAHELGHAFGAQHDEAGKVSDPECYSKEYIMWYSAYEIGTEVWNKFSSCSKAAIKAFVESPAASCLYADSYDEDILKQQQCVDYIGDKLTILDQCREVTPTTIGVCENNIPNDKTRMCDSEPFLCFDGQWCRTVLLHDGTKCGTDKICLGGECVVDSRNCTGVDPLNVPTQPPPLTTTQPPCPEPTTCCTSGSRRTRRRCCRQFPIGCTCNNC